ncbi:MAG: DegT/DnrJ/EryC1/StrS family aminotransferase [Planctomycetes bacterium]|nr:DegT/DnrJ/EryC1/StrS family aminotransferase [Planctomycetota bacterium]
MSKLAIDGGSPVRSTPFPSRVMFDQTEMDAVVDLMKRSMTGEIALDRYGGVHVDAYEKEFAAYFGVRHATAVSSGTAAVHSALGAIRLEAGSEVICSPITDPGAVMPILFQHCIPIFADADPDTFNLSPDSVRQRVTPRSRAIVCSHIAGQPCDMDPIMEIAKRHNLVVIEDCAQAHDAVYRGRKAGTIGHLGTFSLMSGKHTTAGGQGGMVMTDNEEYYWNAKRFADRGKPFNLQVPGNVFLGLNYRMTEIEAAIGRIQLNKMADIIARRRTFIRHLQSRLTGLHAVRLYKVIEGAESAWWFGFLRIDTDRLRVTKAQFADALAREGIPCGAAYDYILAEKPFIRDRQTFGRSGCPWACHPHSRYYQEPKLPGARQAIDRHITFTIHECMGEREAEDMTQALRKLETAYLR